MYDRRIGNYTSNVKDFLNREAQAEKPTIKANILALINVMFKTHDAILWHSVGRH
jgi:hypothetical protein